MKMLNNEKSMKNKNKKHVWEFQWSFRVPLEFRGVLEHVISIASSQGAHSTLTLTFENGVSMEEQDMRRHGTRPFNIMRMTSTAT